MNSLATDIAQLNPSELAIVEEIGRKGRASIAELEELPIFAPSGNKSSAVRNSLRRPTKLGRIEKVGRGVYAIIKAGPADLMSAFQEAETEEVEEADDEIDIAAIRAAIPDELLKPPPVDALGPECFGGTDFPPAELPAPSAIPAKPEGWRPPISGKAEQDRRTPVKLFRELERRFGLGKFTVDVACTSENVLVPNQDVEPNHDALSELFPWLGSVFCNPPWDNIEPFVHKAVDQVREQNADVVVMLVPARTTMAWWEYAIAHGARVHYIRGRVAYATREVELRPDGTKRGRSAPFEHSVVLVFERAIEADRFR